MFSDNKHIPMAPKTSSEGLPNQGIHSNDVSNDPAAEDTISPTVPFDATDFLQPDDTALEVLLTWNAREAFKNWVPSTPNVEGKWAGARTSTSLDSPKKKQKTVGSKQPTRLNNNINPIWVQGHFVQGHFRNIAQKSRTGSPTGTLVKPSLLQKENATKEYKASRSRRHFSDQSASSNGA